MPDNAMPDNGHQGLQVIPGIDKAESSPNETDVHVIVEIPKGSRNKYEYRHGTDEIWLDRHLFTATLYPADYGFVVDTLAEDGDPLDVLVILEEPTFPGCHLYARPIGVFWMSDDAGPDAKILAVPADDPRWSTIRDIDDVSEHLRAEIGHFFEVYKALEPAKFTEVRGWQGRTEARQEIVDAQRRFHEQDDDSSNSNRLTTPSSSI